jgi:transcription elongation factor Elf1
VCPHCDYVDEDLCDYPEELNEDYATTTMTCGNCEQEFKVSMTISYSYSTEKLKEDNP